jgi:hypothetical protein
MKPETTLKKLLKPPFIWDKGKLYLSNYAWLELHAGSICNLDYIEFVRQALNEKWERDFGEKPKWKKSRAFGQDWFNCPRCGDIYNPHKSFNYCPHCGQQLLPPEEKEEAK